MSARSCKEDDTPLGYMDQLDGLRFIAVCAVMFEYFFQPMLDLM